MNDLINAFKANKLEELFVANWTQFIDSSKLMAFVLQKIHENKNQLAIISNAKIKNTGFKITLSRCCLKQHGFILWVEFSTALTKNQLAEGTMELVLSHTGSISYVFSLGNIYCA